eukprot:3932785-Pleurochrysis_carterae.AAC.8
MQSCTCSPYGSARRKMWDVMKWYYRSLLGYNENRRVGRCLMAQIAVRGEQSGSLIAITYSTGIY